MGVAPTLEHATLASEAKKDPSRGGLDGSVLLRQGAPEGEGGRGNVPATVRILVVGSGYVCGVSVPLCDSV